MTLRRVLVEISVTEQRYQAVLEVRAGSTVTDVSTCVLGRITKVRAASIRSQLRADRS